MHMHIHIHIHTQIQIHIHICFQMVDREIAREYGYCLSPICGFTERERERGERERGRAAGRPIFTVGCPAVVYAGPRERERRDGKRLREGSGRLRRGGRRHEGGQEDEHEGLLHCLSCRWRFFLQAFPGRRPAFRRPRRAFRQGELRLRSSPGRALAFVTARFTHFAATGPLTLPTQLLPYRSPRRR